MIYPGDVIRMVYVNGKPRLTVDRADTSDLGNARTHMPNGTIKLSPRPRVSKLDSVIPAIPLDAVQSFLVDNRVVTETELDGAPYVVAGGDQRIVLGAGDKVYVRGKLIENQTAFGIYRKGAPFKDPDTGELLGWEAKQLGLSKLISIDDEISTLRLLNTNKDIRVGDRLLPTIERKVESVFY
ncbi:MAG: peptidoglycan-binding protein, partial [Gammaproteobacteria bacterium]